MEFQDYYLIEVREKCGKTEEKRFRWNLQEGKFESFAAASEAARKNNKYPFRVIKRCERKVCEVAQI